MKNLLLFPFLFISLFGFGQFHRTFFNAAPQTYSRFSNHVYVDYNGQLNIVRASLDNNTILLDNQLLSSRGEVLQYNHILVPLTTAGITEKILGISGVNENQNFRFFTLKIKNGSEYKLLYIKFNKTQHSVSQIKKWNGKLLNGISNTKLINQQLVTYDAKKNGDVVRIALNVNTWNFEPPEILPGASGNSSNMSQLQGKLFYINQKEVFVAMFYLHIPQIYYRNGSNNYTHITTDLSQAKLYNAFQINNSIIAVTNGKLIEKYQFESLIDSTHFPAPISSKTSYITYFKNNYYVFQYNSSQDLIHFYQIDKNFQNLTGFKVAPYFRNYIYQSFPYQNKMLILGGGLMSGLDYSLNGDPTGKNIYCELFSDIPKLKYSEYFYTFRPLNSNLTARMGIGLNFLTNQWFTQSLLLNNRNLIFHAMDMFFCKSVNGDTLQNVNPMLFESDNLTPGPCTNYSDYDEVQEARYNRNFHVSKQAIIAHIDSIQSGSTTYIPDPNILFWPGNGNTAIGQPAIIAPFADLNHDGKYEPMQGEYPLIYGNDCVFSIVHYKDKGNPSKAFAFHVWTYTQTCDTSDVYKDVLFRKIKLISHGASLDSLQFGSYVGGDIGFPLNDYAGTNANLGLGYFYNGSISDPGTGGLPGFNDTLGAVGVLYLKGFKCNDDGIDNTIGIGPNQTINGYGFGDGIIDNEYWGLQFSTLGYGAVNSLQSANWNYLLAGKLNNGDTLYYGDNSFGQYPPPTSIPSRYIYPYKQDSLFYGTYGIIPEFPWACFNADSSGINVSSYDFDMVMSFGMGKLEENKIITFDYAVICSRDKSKTDSLFEPVMGLFNKARKVRNAFLLNKGPCGFNFNLLPDDFVAGVNESTLHNNITIYPNPSKGSIRIKNVVGKNVKVFIYSMGGQMVRVIPHYTNNQTIDISNLKKGIYFVSVKVKNGYINHKILKY